ncbi:6-phosphogluconate dehydrogenase, decarboxylating [Candidatus Erwinia haradaeae]|uniref:6-phosphogluconate dehydrogenase, decarboxylating n=1 Tax=Candidatus Erwinia haradaeae TaxID=1922217 RepID=A0A451DC99_9GAMM|nr:NADP-dependent phosphogluconate dehydrogenase [Candidatus Erwinia haradaeae]VFP84048.1 6-phosphogluconate dehydrogenase, decarboxylating [Candidatus Erwinia haradaeae]
MSKQHIGVIGMAVMGRNLALNLNNKGYSVAIFNRSHEKTDHFLLGNAGTNLVPYYTIKTFINALQKPRCILLMIKAGEATDKIIGALLSYLDHGDIIMDGGNAFYKDTVRRNYELAKKGVYFLGAGISGGATGALHGPSLMIGGHEEAYKIVAPILTKIAAIFQGEVCIAHIGPGGSGHYVKMVHNGIEYSDMQLIAESYSLLKNALNVNNKQLAQIFHDWNKGELNSYLIGITQHIFNKKDENHNYLLDFILDESTHKDTGKWTSQNALDLNEPLSLITASVFARYISALKSQRIKAAITLSGPHIHTVSGNNISIFIEKVRQALYLGKVISYAQGFSQLKAASVKNNWSLKYGEIAKIFRAGCIIRAQLLQKIADAYSQNSDIDNLILSPYFTKIANEYHTALRDVVTYAVINGIPTPAFSAAIAYYDSYRSAQLPANLIQAQRDYFGAHTYKRTDKAGVFHTEW